MTVHRHQAASPKVGTLMECFLIPFPTYPSTSRPQVLAKSPATLACVHKWTGHGIRDIMTADRRWGKDGQGSAAAAALNIHLWSDAAAARVQ